WLKRAGKDKHWRMDRIDASSKKADDAAVDQLMGAIFESHIVNDFPDAAQARDGGLDKPVAEISLWEEGINNLDEKGSGSGSGTGSGSGSASGSGSGSRASSSSPASSTASGSGSGTGSAEKEKDITELRLEVKAPDEPKVKLSIGSVRDNNLYIRRTEYGDKT